MIALLLFSAAIAESIVEIVNNDPKSTWVAVEYPASMPHLRKSRGFLGEQVVSALPARPIPMPDGYPNSFDGRTSYYYPLQPVREERNCPACWAFVTAAMLGNRFMVAGCPVGVMSPQDLIACDTTNYGCKGGAANASITYVATKGCGLDSCLPYASGSSGSAPICPTRCMNGTTPIRYKFTRAYIINDSRIYDDIFLFGPVYARFNVYNDFLSYKSGVYSYVTGKLLGSQGVMCLGWGEQDGVPYWLMMMDWGTAFGEQGFFKIRRGTNECGCENNWYAGYVSCDDPIIV